MVKNHRKDTMEELSLEEIQAALSKQKRSLGPIVEFAAHRQYVEGMPKVVGVPVRMSENPAERMLEMLKASLDMPYDGNDPSLANLTMGEAMNIQEARKAAQGDSAAYNRIMDRLVGAPVQRSQSMSFTGDLSDFLDKVSDQTKEVTIDVTAEVKPNMDDL